VVVIALRRLDGEMLDVEMVSICGRREVSESTMLERFGSSKRLGGSSTGEVVVAVDEAVCAAAEEAALLEATEAAACLADVETLPTLLAIAS
jgi:hypothetical protein